jgi:hypothetical protein
MRAEAVFSSLSTSLLSVFFADGDPFCDRLLKGSRKFQLKLPLIGTLPHGTATDEIQNWAKLRSAP